MQTIKGNYHEFKYYIIIETHEYEEVKKVPLKQRLMEHWNAVKLTVPYILAIIFIQIINLMLTLMFNVYSEGVIINIVILSILIASLLMDLTRK